MLFRGIKFKLVSLFIVFFGAALILFSYFLSRSFVKDQQQEFDVSLYNYTVDVVSSIKVNLFGETFLSPDFSKNADKIFPFSLGKTYVLIRSIDGVVLVRSQNSLRHEFPYTTRMFQNVRLFGKDFVSIYVDADEDPTTKPNYFRMITHKIETPGRGDLIIQIAAPMDLLERQQKRLSTFFFITIPFVLIFATIAGWIFTRGALDPVANIIKKAKQISVGNLSERIPSPDSHDEIHTLVESLNDLLSRLENAFASQERFVSDASHQLKTPLAIIKGELEMVKNKNVSEVDYKHLIQSLSEEVTDLSLIVENLLLLARVDAGIEKFKLVPVLIGDVVVSQIARLEKLAKSKNIRMIINISNTETQLEVLAEEELLGCLIHNLIENAIKYSPENSTIEVRIFPEGNKVITQVKDSGPGIPTHEQSKIFDRFYRAEFTSNKKGYGLGLALAKKISEVLGGIISVQNNTEHKGAIFSFQMDRTS